MGSSYILQFERNAKVISASVIIDGEKQQKLNKRNVKKNGRSIQASFVLFEKRTPMNEPSFFYIERENGFLGWQGEGLLLSRTERKVQ